MTFPTDLFLIDDITITDNNAVLTNDTRSLQYRARSVVGQRFEVAMTTRVLPENRKAALAYISSLKGGIKIDTLSLPYFFEAASGTKLVNTAAAIGASTVTLQSIDNVNAGDYIKFGGHTKIYQIIAKSGTSINIHPNLVRSVAVSEQVLFNGISMTVQSKKPVQTYTSEGRYTPMAVDFSFVEAIS